MLKTIGDFIKINSIRLISTGVSILVALTIIGILKIIISRFIKKSKHRRAITIARLVQSIFRYTIVIITFIAIMGIWGFDITTLLAGAGIAGLVIGLGAQSLIKDLLGGISIVFDNSYEVDDIIEINGFKGKVVEIGLRSTHIMNWKGDLKIITNGEIKEVINYSKYFSTASVVLNIDYRENVEKVVLLLEEKLPSIKESFPQIVEGPNVMGVSNLGANGYEISITAKTLPEQHYAVERALRKRLIELLTTNNIKVPYNKVELFDERDR